MNKNSFIKIIKENIIETIFFLLYVVLLVFFTQYHEPWFDEFQAWGISRDSLYNILFVIPHNEGHPPLWHLILKCFSYFHIPAEIGLRIPNILFISTAMWLLMFKSPFATKYKVCIPFTYFLFYQYGMINRPYSLLCLAMFLLALFFKERNIKPFRFISAITLLCLSSAYGMVLSTGIILVWAIEVLKEKSFSKFLHEFFIDKRTISMFIIFLVCLVLAIEICPNANTYEMMPDANNDKMMKFLYSFFGITGDSLYSNFYGVQLPKPEQYNFIDFIKPSFDSTFNLIILNFWYTVIAGLFANILIIKFFKDNKKLLLYSIPVFMFLFMAFGLYLCQHHTGIYVITLITLFWATMSDSDSPIKYNKIMVFALNLTIIIQIFWAFMAVNLDRTINYSFGRDVVKTIKEYKLDNYKTMAAWRITKFYVDNETNKYVIFPKNDNFELKIKSEPLMQVIPVSVNQYLWKNIFYSFDITSPNKNYIALTRTTPEETQKITNRMFEDGLPEIIIGHLDIDEIISNYKIITIHNFGRIWKNSYISQKLPVYARNDIYDEVIRNKDKQ